MIRRWQVQPDQMFVTRDGDEIPVVSRGAFVEAVLDAVSLVDRAGGGFSVVAGRMRTGMEGEMVTTGLVVEWRDRTDAKPAPEQPAAVPDLSAAHDIAQHGVEPPAGDDPTQYRGGEPVDDIGDGLDPATLAEEDESSVETVR